MDELARRRACRRFRPSNIHISRCLSHRTRRNVSFNIFSRIDATKIPRRERGVEESSLRDTGKCVCNFMFGKRENVPQTNSRKYDVRIISRECVKLSETMNRHKVRIPLARIRINVRQNAKIYVNIHNKEYSIKQKQARYKKKKNHRLVRRTWVEPPTLASC